MLIRGRASLSSEDDGMPCIGFVSQRVSAFTRLSSSKAVRAQIIITATSSDRQETPPVGGDSQQGEVKNVMHNSDEIKEQETRVGGCANLSSEPDGMPSAGCVSERVAAFTKIVGSKCTLARVTATSSGQPKTRAAHTDVQQGDVQNTMPDSDAVNEQQILVRGCDSLNSEPDDIPSTGCVSQRVFAFTQLSSSKSQSSLSVTDAPGVGLVSERIRAHQQFISTAAY